MWSLADASPERLRAAARDIEALGKWVGFLTPQEHQIFALALGHSPETWRLFLKGSIPCQLRIAGSDEDDGAAIIDVDAVTLAFRVRYMIWELHIDSLYDPSAGAAPDPPQPASKPADNDEDEDYDDDSGEDAPAAASDETRALELLIIDTKHEDSEPETRARPVVQHNSVRRYDTFEADLDQIKRFQRLKESDDQIQNDEYQTLDDPAGAANGSNAVSATAAAAASMANGSAAASSALAGSTGAGGAGSTSSLAAFAKAAQFGSANLCLKHLLTTIEARRDEMHVTDIELRNLISDVRKNRSKWANEDRIGQEELYEACERVVQELRGYTEHSTAFLNKVSKREAPNYYEVIKNPMDLNSVMRKIRAFQYNSKAEFVDDLNLIWSNCLTYNSDPAHYLRKHAIAMRQKTQALAPLIPDVVVRSRAEVEAEAEREEQLARERMKKRRNSDDGGKRSQKRSRAVPPESSAKQHEPVDKSVDKSVERPVEQPVERPERPVERPVEQAQDPVKQEAQDSVKQEDSHTDSMGDGTGSGNNTSTGSGTGADTESTNDSATETDKSASGKSTETAPAATPTATPTATHTAPAQTETGESTPTDSSSNNDEMAELFTLDDEEYKAPDVETMVWDSITRRQRLHCITSRQLLFANNKLQMDAPISPRTPGAMMRFDQTLKGEDASSQLTGMSLLSNDPGDDPFLIEYEVNAGLPPSPPGDVSAWLHAPMPKLSELAPSQYSATGQLNRLLLRNLNEMQLIRRLCAKILFIRDLQGGQMTMDFTGSSVLTAAGNSGGGIGGGISFASGGYGSGPGGGAGSNSIASEYPEVREPEDDISSRLPGAARFNRAAAVSSMKRAVAKLAMASGFEAAQPSTVDCLAGIAGDYLSKLGMMLVSNLEAPNSTASFGSILRGSLEEMGVERLSQLTNYISDDVLRQGRRLATFRSRLNYTLVEILRPEVERYQDEQFQDNSEQFVLGQFSNELGDDYFGFKELGIDKELGISSMAIPFHLLQQRIADSRAGISRSGKIRVLDLPVPEYPPLLPRDIEQLPAFVRPAFEKILIKYTPSSPHAPGQDAKDAAGAGTNGANEDYITQAAAQAALARAKVPASGKLVVRKKRFDKAYILTKPTPPSSPAQAPDEEAKASVPEPDTHSPLSAQPSSQIDNELGSLAFDEEDEEPQNVFTFDDTLPTGSLLLHGEDDEPEAGEDDLGLDFK